MLQVSPRKELWTIRGLCPRGTATGWVCVCGRSCLLGNSERMTSQTCLESLRGQPTGLGCSLAQSLGHNASNASQMYDQIIMSSDHVKDSCSPRRSPMFRVEVET
ncbi:hypothetical protein CEXT_569831 [Caerostris extrusa]|uniref:Uncharacterized protein n=1 Tax=Caerostris extrusa TaxID=172846 RepID=A0AAV4VTR6_CAEEX|nr:hypothetical protein CEXT_569831 [Caerostris extrusa]